MDTMEKLTILSASAKYDAACTSSGSDRSATPGTIGNATACGICHSFAGDGRCISLLKVLMTNSCIYNCQYCVNRRTNDTPRATFTPRELADLTIRFYRRNYIEGLFLSSGVLRNPDYTVERMIETLRILREEYRFGGYIHAKAIPGADPALLSRMGLLADRMSVNIELPSQQSLRLLAPDKSKTDILGPMGFISGRIGESKQELARYRHAPAFAPAGQSTQMIIGATPDTDFQILTLSEALYKKYRLRRVFYSAYMPVSDNPLLPALTTPPPLMREHRLYQADWLIRYYGFTAGELLDKEHPHLHPLVDPKCNWALNHMEYFPVEVNTAPKELLLRVPGIGVKSCQRILAARRTGSLDFAGLKRLGVVLKRAQYFILCKGRQMEGLRVTEDAVLRSLISERCRSALFSQAQTGIAPSGAPLAPGPVPTLPPAGPEQLCLFAPPPITREDVAKCLTGQM